jgi:hypothetical protein
LGKSQAFSFKIGDILGNLGTLDDLDTQKNAKKAKKSVDKYMVLCVYLGMKNDNKTKGIENG